MKKLFKEWIAYFHEYGWKRILDAFFGGFVFSSIVFVPVYVILSEVLIVYMYMVHTITILLIVAAMGHNVLWHHLTKQALFLKLPEAETKLRRLFFWSMVLTNLVILILGLVILFVLIPIWMV